MRIAVFPGSFDPITLAHVDVIQRALPLFDKVIIAVGVNSRKKHLLSPESRIQILEEVFKRETKISVSSYSGLTVDFCKSVQADFIIRGLRSVSDFEFEKPISQNNQDLSPDIQTLFLISSPGLEHISSTIVREVHQYAGNISAMVPQQVIKALRGQTLA